MHRRNVAHSELALARAFPHAGKPPEGWAPFSGRASGSMYLGSSFDFECCSVSDTAEARRPIIGEQSEL